MLFLFRMGRLDRRISRAVTAAAVPLRLQGRLRRSERGFLLEMEDGHVWRLEGAQDFPPLVDATVIVEGRKASPSLLDVLWLGPA
ncbi:hypothetical protein HY78_24570 [Rhizorhabdus wittichii DC-6]|jgi:hypothetical protein|nr:MULTISPECIES: DUF5818 domain-containing protein [Sphingomonadales]ARR56400.1 hypothetical protein HY78_24570 [Rhizorhabdus wittichii DC-6]TXH16022.1 MAG: hypothetical protein E6R00_06670 [Gammaproteobacteria bacterium]AMK24734.1 hypothetical protein K426_19025 [Sphingobium sp. TKS]AZI37472.1 hypothetical protein EGO55_17080 [Caenibius tardaugens NBRC 16725]WDA35137.1 DUF5818 domain-containing protein [Sphingobium sp. YC-XJ3]